jgi:SSS family solute:Na+ symporter
MSSLAIYIIVLVVYLSILVITGLLTSKQTRNVEDFHIGSRKIGPWVTSLSYVAAYFSSVVIVGGGGFGYKFGMTTIWIGAINVLVGTLLCWIILGPRIRQFTLRLKTITVPGFLGERYESRFANIFTAFIVVILLIVYNISILKGMGHIFEVLMNMPYFWGLVISGMITFLYVAVGGYMAVVWTSFIQAWVMAIGLIIMTIFSLKAVGGISAANQALNGINSGLVNTPGVWGWSGLISYALIVSFGVWGMPQMVVRFYSIKNLKVLKVGTIVATIATCLAFLPYFNGAIARVLFPGLKSPDLAIPTLVKATLSPFGASLVLTAVLAAGMSTLSSVMIIISGSLIHDLFEKGFKVKFEGNQSLTFSKVASLVIGLISMVLAIKPPALILTLTAFAWALIASVTLWPILFGIFWKGVTKTACVASMIGGFITALVWLILKNPWGIHGFIPGVLVSLILIVVISLFTTKYSKEHIAKIWGE